jgi:hypothetical protein
MLSFFDIHIIRNCDKMLGRRSAVFWDVAL